MSEKYCILQDDLKDCGVCSLLSIIKFYDGEVSKEYLRELTRTNKDGVNALNLLKASRELGFEAYGIKAKIKDIKDNNLPLIAHITVEKKYNHFIVIYKIDHRKNRLLVMDPARGYLFLPFSNFANMSTGYYLIMKPKQLIPKFIENNNFFDDVKNVFMKNKTIIVWVIIESMAFIIINVIDSYQFKLFFDEPLNDDIHKIFFLLLILIMFKYLTNFFRNNLINLINFLIDKNIVYKAYNHIINLPYLYYKNHTNGDLLTRINDLGNIKELISNLFVCIFVDLFFAIIILIIMFFFNKNLTLIVLGCLTLYIVIVLIYNYYLVGYIKENIRKSSIVNNYLIESLASFETIKNMSLQDYIINNFMNKYLEFNLNKKKLLKKINTENLLKNIIVSLNNILIIYFGVTYIYNQKILLPTLITFITLSNYLTEPIRKILDLSIMYLNSKESIKRIIEIYRIPKEVIAIDKRKSIKSLNGNIIISNLNYSYNGIDNIFFNISMEIEEGQKVLLKGKSGSGKSTLMRLLIKYIDNNYQGNIIIDGFNLNEIELGTLRKNICYVSQEEYLYTDSVYENITLGRKISYEKFLLHAKGLFIDEIVKKSVLGYNYLIENNGENLSGGERMRIIIARSIIRAFNIYIYDETFSGLDVTLERDILNYLFKLYPDKTFIIVSHRDSNCDLYDKIIKFGEENA